MQISLFVLHSIISNNSNNFVPSSLTINVGDTLVFSNAGGYHNVNGTLATYKQSRVLVMPCLIGVVWLEVQQVHGLLYIFTIPGSYTYQCDPHVGMGMVGTIIVNFIQFLVVLTH